VKITVDLLSDDLSAGSLPLDTGELERYAVRVLESEGVAESDVNVVFIDETRMTELNKTYRGKSGPTDVLSFRLSEEHAGKLEGEVYICLKLAGEQASEYGVPYAEEVVRLITHGLLHLSGRVHDGDEERRIMEDATEKFVERFFAGGDKR